MKFYQQEGFWITLVTAALVICISLLPQLHKTLFVPESGRFLIYGEGLGGVILAFTLLFKWKYARMILGGTSLVGFVGCIFLTFYADQKFQLSYGVLSAVLGAVVCLLFFSSSMEIYLKGSGEPNT